MAALLRWPVGQLVLRAAVTVLPLLALGAGLGAGGRPSTGTWSLAAIVAIAGGLAPSTAVAAGAPLLVLAWWTFAVPDPLSGWVLLAGACLLLAHLAAGLSELGPPALAPGTAALRSWAGRGLVVAPALPAAWAVARLGSGPGGPPGLWVTAAATSALALVGLATALRRT